MTDEAKTKAQLIAELRQLRQRVTELEARATEPQPEPTLLNRADHRFPAALQLGQVLTLIMEGVRCLLDANICSLWLLDPQTDELVCWRATGYRYDLVQGWRLKPEQGIVNWAVRHDQSLIVPDTRLDPRHYKEIDRLIGLELRSILSVPLRGQAQVIGALQVTDTAVDQFKPTALNLVEALAATAAAAIEKTRLYEPAQQTFNRPQTEARVTKLAEQFHQSQKMEAIGRLAGGMAHHFNNLLTAIMGYAGLALHHLPADHAVRPDLEGVQRTAHRAAELTHQLLTFTRHQISHPQVLDLNDFLDQVEPSLRRLIGPEIELVRRTEPELGAVKVDPDQLEQVLVNLVANARDAMPAGGQLTLETAKVSLDQRDVQPYIEVKPGPYVLLAVQDSGPGMSEAVQRHLFEPFFTTKEGGQGLGLASCYGLVLQNEGHLTVESEPGQGSTFKIYLPRVETEPGRARPSRPSGERLAGGETILLVEDEVGVRSLLARILGRYGYRVLEASNGPEALRLLEAAAAQPIQLLITDMTMPQMSGRTLAEQVKTQQPRLKVLFISGYPGSTLRDKGMLEPDTFFLSKPFTPLALVRKVREVLEG